MKAIEDKDGVWGGEMVACKWCAYYHHGDGTCNRHAPSPLVDILITMYDEIRVSLPTLDLTDIRTSGWVSVDEGSFCGEFLRGAAGGSMTIEEQKEAFIRGGK